jgi:Leucine-rich repeat (LRR) protein
MGGKVGLSGRTEWIEDVDNIPAAKELLIERISLVYDDNKRTKVLNLIDLGPFAILKELTSLELRGHPIGDRSCTFLAEMVKLKKLNLHACSITDAGLKRLEPLSNLESLDIGYSLGKITDEGAKSLLKMPKLKHMNIYSSSISDETLRDVFAKLPDLESVELTTTNVTENGIAELKKANPKLNVIKY